MFKDLEKELNKAYLFPNDPKENAKLFAIMTQTNLEKNLLNDFLNLFCSNGELFFQELKKYETKKQLKIKESEKLKIKKCLEFLKKHFNYAITLKVRPEKYKINQFKNFEFTINNKKILFEKIDMNLKNCTYDFVITKEKQLKIGHKHYFLSEESSFVYGAGRLEISPDGQILNVDNYSGHYHPDKKDLMNAIYFLKNMDLEINKFTYINFCFFN